MNDQTTTELEEYDVEQIPDRWEITLVDSRRPQWISLRYNVSGYYDPVATVSLLPPNSDRNTGDNFCVEVQDMSGDGLAMGYLNPQIVWDEFEGFDEAQERFYELAERYPLEETRRLPQPVEREELVDLLCSYVSVERDRLLGYQADQLGEDPNELIEQTLSVLHREGEPTDEIVTPDDQDALNINFHQHS